MSYTDPQIGTLTLSGDPARFVATERVPVSGLSMDFEPVQDLHGQEYPYPGGGGVNIFDADNLDTVAIENSGSTLNVYGHAFSKPGSYAIKAYGTGAGAYLYGRVKKADDTWSTWYYIVGGTVATQSVITIEQGDTLYVYDALTSHTIQTASERFKEWKIQVAYASTQPAVYHPYSNICPITGRDSVTVYVSPEPSVVDDTEEHDIEFGQSVYAGQLSINEDGSGTIVSKYVNVDMGSLNWSLTPNATNVWQIVINDKKDITTPPYTNRQTSIICSAYGADSQISISENAMHNCKWLCNGKTIYIKDTAYSSAADFKTSVTGQQLVYELAEPVTIQLDPIEITTLIGLNYVWTSDNNLITISFPYNKEVQPMTPNYEHCWTYPKAYIDKLTARIAALETKVAALEAAADAKTAAAPDERNETVAEEITVTEEPETAPVTKKGGK